GTFGVGDWFLGGYRGTARRSSSAHCGGGGRNDQRVRYVQRAGNELLAVAAGDGPRRHASAIFHQAASDDAGSMGLDHDLRGGMGDVFGTWTGPAGNHRYPAVRGESGA